MTKKKQFHLKIKWKNREKTEAHEIVLYDGGQPLCELISVDDARLVRDIMNEQDTEIKRLECINRQLEERLDRSIALDMSRCGKYVYGVHGGSND